MAELTEEDSPSADEGELESSLANRLNTDGEIPVAWTFDLRRKGVDVLMERDWEMKEVDGDDEAARKTVRRMRCLEFC
jgi:hypothetical protein